MKKIIFVWMLLAAVVAQAQRAIPEFWGHYVYDEAHVLSQPAVDRLEAMLKAHADSTTNQLAVLIIPSLEGEVLEEYALRVAHDTWKLGEATKDNGALLLIAIDDRKMRIEVGQGLEGTLTDAVTNRIIRNEIAPRFREQDYDGGVIAAVDAMIRAIGNEYTAEETGADDGSFEANLSWKERLLIGAFIFGILGLFTFLGLFASGCAGWFLYAFLIPFYATFPMAVLGVNGGLTALGVYAIGFPIAKLVLSRTAWGKRMIKKIGNNNRRGGGGSTGGGWTSGSGWFSGGGSGGGWSSGGGGFSGGGGSFSGGGSSGSW